MATKKETGKIPVIVGVTGHRDLREQDGGAGTFHYPAVMKYASPSSLG